MHSGCIFRSDGRISIKRLSHNGVLSAERDMSEKYIMALDQGTTSSRCILFDKTGSICSQAQQEFPQIFPHPGWVEHNPWDIWETQLQVAKEAMHALHADPSQIAAIGITNQRETTVVWDAETGEPVYNAIVWQCRRTAEAIDSMKNEGWSARVQDKTGLIPDAYFSASKVAWILEHVPGAKEKAEQGELRFGTIDSWLIWNLTDRTVHVTDYTNASRTMLYDIKRLCWDQELLAYFGIPESMLPQVLPSSGILGYTESLGGRIPIAGVAGDQQAALFGQCGFQKGDVKSTYGTGGFMLLNTGSEAVHADNGLLTTIAAFAPAKKDMDETGDEASWSDALPVQYALEGSVFVAGAAVQWLRDELKILRTAAESERYCREAPDTDGVYVVPAFTGMGAPYWNPYARGCIFGLTRGAERAHLIRATVESLAYQTEDLLQAMRDASGLDIRELLVDGGASANDFLMQFQADISASEIIRPKCIETTALGAAYLAGLAVGYWDGTEEILKNRGVDKVFILAGDKEKRERRLSGWKRAVKAALSWANG